MTLDIATTLRPRAGDDAVAAGAIQRLLKPPGLVDPYPDYALLRQHAPVYLSAFGVCFVSGYEECKELLGSPDFAVQDVAWFDANTPGWRDNAATLTLYQGVQSRNPPEHTRLRRSIGGAFGPRRMAALSERVAAITDEHLDAVQDAGSAGAAVDLVSTLCFPLPVAVIGEMLGVPQSDREYFSSMARRIFAMMDLVVTDEDRRRADESARELRRYWIEAVAERHRYPRADLASELTAARDAGTLDDEELLAILVFLFAAGFGTTAALLGNAVVALLEQPAIAAALRNDGALAAPVVEESLRHETPTQIDPRVAIRDTVLGGVPIRAGQFVIALLGAGNRDPRHFPDPDRFDISRPDTWVLSFGGGIHYCLGAPLSRMEASVVLPRLFRRLPALALAGEPARVPTLRMRHFSELLVYPAG